MFWRSHVDREQTRLKHCERLIWLYLPASPPSLPRPPCLPASLGYYRDRSRSCIILSPVVSRASCLAAVHLFLRLRNNPLITMAQNKAHRLTTFQRMGSFNSAPKILNDDHQDKNLIVPPRMSRGELMDFCSREKVNSFQLLQRPFQLRESPISEHLKCMSLSEKSSENSSNLRVFQWNILSQTLGQTNDNFVLCPENALTWDFRKFHLMEEIIQHNADVICLQEVDHFEFIQKLLATQGYAGVFYPKPDSPCVYIEGNNGPDGCAIFYKKDKFECIAEDSKILEVWKVQSNQVAVLLLLRSLQTQQEICVATTHLKARNGALLSKLRNEQGKDLLEFISARSGRRPVIICGDFNAEPSEPVYKTVLSNKNLDLGSAYANFMMPEIEGSSNPDPEEWAAHEVPYTTWKVREEGEVCHTIDYIFYSRRHLRVNGILCVPTPEDVGEGKVPSYHYPSDHFSLVCDFSFKKSE